MNKPTLRDWAQIAEIIASLGVIISLVFVASSIERSNSLISAEISDDTYDALRSAQELTLQDPKLLALTELSQQEIDDLEGTDRALYREWVGLHLDQWERLYSRSRDGLISEENSWGWEAYFRLWFARQVTRDLWNELRWRHTTVGFREMLDAELAQQVPMATEG